MARRAKRQGFSERELVSWIRKRSKENAPFVKTGPGDDAAVVSVASGDLLFAIDTVAEGVDFTLETASGFQIGRKAVAVNLSDMAAMGARGLFCLASVNLRRGLPSRFAKGLYRGIESLCGKFECPLVGGDVTTWEGGVVATVAIGGKAAGARAIERGGAAVGDRLFVTGSLGGSILGKHLKFTPRVEEAAWLAKNCTPTAMIDISDGLGVDAAHIAAESGVGFAIDAERIPVSRASRRLARSRDKSALGRAVSDGEDFELLFTLGAEKAQKCAESWPFETKLTQIGSADTGEGVRLIHKDNTVERIDTEGYEHT